jgi:hypothetical protein
MIIGAVGELWRYAVWSMGVAATRSLPRGIASVLSACGLYAGKKTLIHRDTAKAHGTVCLLSGS